MPDDKAVPDEAYALRLKELAQQQPSQWLACV